MHSTDPGLSSGPQVMPAAPKARWDILTEALGDGTVIVFDPKKGCAHELNPSAALVWDCCDGQHTPEAMAELFAECFGLRSTFREDILAFLKHLRDIELLEP